MRCFERSPGAARAPRAAPGAPPANSATCRRAAPLAPSPPERMRHRCGSYTPGVEGVFYAYIWLWVNTLTPGEHKNRWYMGVHPQQNGGIGCEPWPFCPPAPEIAQVSPILASTPSTHQPNNQITKPQPQPVAFTPMLMKPWPRQPSES